MPITVVSVAKSYSNRGNHQHRQGTKKRGYLYFIDEDGNFRTRRINALEALYYRGKKAHRYRVICPVWQPIARLWHGRSRKRASALAASARLCVFTSHKFFLAGSYAIKKPEYLEAGFLSFVRIVLL